MMIERNKPILPARAPILALLLVAWMGMSGCSSVPDAVNPVEWYRGAAGWFESDEGQAQRDQARTAAETAPPLPGANRDYPNLSTVPERPRSVSSPEERNRVASGLAADRENARYAKPEPGRPSGAALGAPAAAPRTLVVTDPSGPSSETLEALPLDSVPVTPVPRSSREDVAPAQTAAAVPVSVEPPSAAPPAVMPMPDAAPAQVTAPAQQVLPSETMTSPKPSLSLLEQTYNAAIAEQNASAAAPGDYSGMPGVLPAATSGAFSGVTSGVTPSAISKTAAGTPVPGSFVVHFRGGSAEISPSDRALLRDVAQLYKSTNGRLRIVGHTSSNTREKDALSQKFVNLRISLERAEAVARELERLGVPRANMTVAGMSDNEPLYEETTQAGIAGNRRVEIFFGS